MGKMSETRATDVSDRQRIPELDPGCRTTQASAAALSDRSVGSYGRGIYASHSTFGLDFQTQDSYGRGVYAGHSTFGLDFQTQGSYGRGIYAGHSAFDLDFQTQGSFATGMTQTTRR